MKDQVAQTLALLPLLPLFKEPQACLLGAELTSHRIPHIYNHLGCFFRSPSRGRMCCNTGFGTWSVLGGASSSRPRAEKRCRWADALSCLCARAGMNVSFQQILIFRKEEGGYNVWLLHLPWCLCPKVNCSCEAWVAMPRTSLLWSFHETFHKRERQGRPSSLSSSSF